MVKEKEGEEEVEEEDEEKVGENEEEEEGEVGVGSRENDDGCKSPAGLPTLQSAPQLVTVSPRHKPVSTLLLATTA